MTDANDRETDEASSPARPAGWERLRAVARFVHALALALLGPLCSFVLAVAVCMNDRLAGLASTTFIISAAFAITGLVATELARRGVLSEAKKLFQLRLSSLFLWTLLASAQFTIWRLIAQAFAGSSRPIEFEHATLALVGLTLFYFTSWPILIFSTTGLFRLGAIVLRVASRFRHRG